MGNKALKFKNDRFKKIRGGHSKYLLLSCEKCKSKLFLYQKDGQGILKRLYLDRIIFPKDLGSKKNLECEKCKTILGILILYQRENRTAFRLFAGAVTKKIIKAYELKGIQLR